MQLRREKGLFYFCDEKFSFNHKCPNRQCFVLQLGDEDAEKSVNESKVIIEEREPVIDDHHLSLNALKGGLGVGTIKFMAYVCSKCLLKKCCDNSKAKMEPIRPL